MYSVGLLGQPGAGAAASYKDLYLYAQTKQNRSLEAKDKPDNNIIWEIDQIQEILYASKHVK